jgi:zinc transporter 9
MLLDLLPLHKEDALTPAQQQLSADKKLAAAKPHDSSSPKPSTTTDEPKLYVDVAKRNPDEVHDLEKTRQQYEQLQREDSLHSSEMDADDIATYEAIERKEKKALEATLLQQPELSYNAVTRALVGNSLITVLKFAVYLRTGSAAMLSEAIHTLVDSGNQAILLVGIRQMSNSSDKRHPYGYGRAAYFWGLVSALGMFWVGSSVSLIHGMDVLLHPPEAMVEPGWETWTTLAISFGVDGYVLAKTVSDMKKSVPDGMSFYGFTKKIRDPFVMAVLLEDMAATTGVLIAVGGIGMTYVTGSHVFDALASCGVGVTLGVVAVYLARMNQRFLLGQAIDSSIEDSIRRIILARPSIEAVHSIQTQWLGPSAFSFKAEVDFDGTYPAATLMRSYAPVFNQMTTRNTMDEDLPVVLALYAEDVTRILETEVKNMEADIREAFPEATYIEIEPDSKDYRERRYAGNTPGGKDWEQERQEIARMSEMVRLSRILEEAAKRKK